MRDSSCCAAGLPVVTLLQLALPAVVMAANAEEGPTCTTVAEHNFGPGYPSFPVTVHEMNDDVRLRRR